MSQSLEDRIQAAGNPVTLLRNSQTGPYVYPVVPPEYTNWRDEQRGWQETCVLFNQSYHMTDMYVSGTGRVSPCSKAWASTRSTSSFPTRRNSSSRATTMDMSSATSFCSIWKRTSLISSAGPRFTIGFDITVRPAVSTRRRKSMNGLRRESAAALSPEKLTGTRFRDPTP